MQRDGFLRGEGKLQAELGAPRVIAVRPTRGSETRGNALLPSGWAHFPEGPGSLPLASGQLDCTPSASSQGHPKIILVCVSPALQHSHDTRGSKKHHLSSPPQLPRSCRGCVTLSSPPHLPRPSAGAPPVPIPYFLDPAVWAPGACRGGRCGPPGEGRALSEGPRPARSLPTQILEIKGNPGVSKRGRLPTPPAKRHQDTVKK